MGIKYTVCIGNSMVSSAIWKVSSEFFKDDRNAGVRRTSAISSL